MDGEAESCGAEGRRQSSGAGGRQPTGSSRKRCCKRRHSRPGAGRRQRCVEANCTNRRQSSARRRDADAHAAGLAAAQKNTAELSKTEARTQIGFDFAIAEECGRWKECGRYRANYGNLVYVIEYRKKDFRKDCQNKKLRKRLSIVLRDINVTQPGSGTYKYRAC